MQTLGLFFFFDGRGESVLAFFSGDLHACGFRGHTGRQAERGEIVVAFFIGMQGERLAEMRAEDQDIVLAFFGLGNGLLGALLGSLRLLVLSFADAFLADGSRSDFFVAFGDIGGRDRSGSFRKLLVELMPGRGSGAEGGQTGEFGELGVVNLRHKCQLSPR